MNRTLLIILTLFFFHFGRSQEIDLSKWKLDSIPLGKKLNEANHSENDWYFKLSQDTILVQKNKYRLIKGDSLPFPIDSIRNINGNKFIKSVFNGYLIGYDHGEFGGGLKYVSSYNDIDYYVEIEEKDNEWNYSIMGRNVRKIFEFNNKIYATRGLAHLGSNYGNLIELIFNDGKWKYKYISSLIETPILTFNYGEFIYIITSQNILKIDKDLNITQILKSPFNWGILYPSSAFIKNRDIYIAMRKGILIIRDFETSPKYEWYVKQIL